MTLLCDADGINCGLVITSQMLGVWVWVWVACLIRLGIIDGFWLRLFASLLIVFFSFGKFFFIPLNNNSQN